jgi:hypothetical protein
MIKLIPLLLIVAIAVIGGNNGRRGRRPYPVKRAIRAGKGL